MQYHLEILCLGMAGYWRGQSQAGDIFSRHHLHDSISSHTAKQRLNNRRRRSEIWDSPSLTCQEQRTALISASRRNHALSTPTTTPPRFICIKSARFISDASLFYSWCNFKLAGPEIPSCCAELAEPQCGIWLRWATQWHQEESGAGKLHAELWVLEDWGKATGKLRQQIDWYLNLEHVFAFHFLYYSCNDTSFDRHH